MTEKFWETTPLFEMNKAQWESLCDGCGKCCLNKIEYEDTGEVDYTRIACKLLDDKTCRCKHYENRHDFVPDCIVLSRETLPKISYWLPKTCAYFLLYTGATLPDWHPLVTGDSESTHKAGMSMRGQTLTEEAVGEDDWDAYIITEAI